jgi:hypothetical protein
MIGQSIARILPNKIALPRAHDGAGEAFPVRASGHGADDAAQRGRCGDFLALGFLGVESILESLDWNGGELLAAHAQLFVHSDFFESRDIYRRFFDGTTCSASSRARILRRLRQHLSKQTFSPNLHLGGVVHCRDGKWGSPSKPNGDRDMPSRHSLATPPH